MEDQQQIHCTIHPKQQILGICLDKKCTQNIRLVCFICTIKLHSAHALNILSIDNLGDPNEISQSWPQNDDLEGSKMRDLLQYLMAVESPSDIENIFNNINIKIKTETEIIKDQVIKHFKETDVDRQKFINKFKAAFCKGFSLQKVHTLFNEYNYKNLNEEEFSENITKFVNQKSDEQLEAQNELSGLLEKEDIKEFVQFDQKVYDQQINEMIHSLRNFAKTLKTENAGLLNSFMFEVCKVKNFATVEEKKKGIAYKMPSTSVIISDRVLKEGKYKFQIKYDLYTAGCIVFGIVDETQLWTSNYWGGLPMVCMSCNSLDAISFALTQGSYMGAFKATGCVYNVELHISQNIFKVSDESGQHIMSATVQFKGPQLRFFINNYGGQLIELSLKDNNYFPDCD